MAKQVIPEGYHTVTPYLLVADVPREIEFLRQAFGAEESYRSTLPDGTVNHAAIRIGDSMVMMGQANEQYPAMPAMLYLYVPDVDATYEQALQAGGTSVRELKDEAYGDRVGGVADEFGNQWWIATHKTTHPS
jgi:PhnB protein